MHAPPGIGRHLATLVIALATASCAVQTDDHHNDPTTSPNDPSPITAAENTRGGQVCAPVLRPDENGQLMVDSWLCPMPQRPEPDPAWNGRIENRDGEWVELERETVTTH